MKQTESMSDLANEINKGKKSKAERKQDEGDLNILVGSIPRRSERD